MSACDGQPKTRITGKVFDPSGTAPIYNAVVYVPNETPAPLARGASCERCADTVRSPVGRAVLTDENGEFSLEGVPDGDNVPITFQIGKWRRQVNVKVTACAENRFDDPSLMHLPRKQSEGEMPQIAVVTGGCDPLGCLFSRMGIDDSRQIIEDEMRPMLANYGFVGLQLATQECQRGDSKSCLATLELVERALPPSRRACSA